LGPIDYSGDAGMSMYYPGAGREHSEKTAEVIDKEVKRLIDESYVQARELIESHREKVESLAKALVKYETLDAADVEIILEGGVLDKPTVSDLLAIEQQRSAEQEPEVELEVELEEEPQEQE
jgi:cell division protease FtsH